MIAMFSFKTLLVCLLAGSSAAFAVQQPQAIVQSRSAALKMTGGAAPAPAGPPPDLKVSLAR
jgi:hypothetical protein